METDLLEEDFRRERRERIAAQSIDMANRLWARFTAPLPTQSPFDCCIEHLVLNDSDTKGNFDPRGREYLRDIIDDNDAIDMREQTVVNGTGTGKTMSNIAGIFWKIKHRPSRGLMVMPAKKGEGGSEQFVMTRLIPALKASPLTAELFPAGQERLFLNSSKVRLNGAHFGFVGANSTGQLGSNRCSDVRLDEADKYRGRLGNEAGTDALAKERTKGVESPHIFRNSTPTVDTGIVWKKLMASNFQRRFLPCPHCNSEVRGRRPDSLNPSRWLLTNEDHEIPDASEIVNRKSQIVNPKGWFDLAWSELLCVLPNKFADGTSIPRAYVTWDKEAKRQDGTFDEQRVFSSARFVCPHCGGHIRDEHQLWMDKNGVWTPLRQGFMMHKGYHLSSLYAPIIPGNESSTLGGRCLEFIEAQQEGEGLKGFINSTLAEVDVRQELGRNSIELISHPVSQGDWVAMLTADFHKNWPYVWFIVRKWSAFKLLPPFPLTNGVPSFCEELQQEQNADVLAICEQLASSRHTPLDTRHSEAAASRHPSPVTRHFSDPVWSVIAELMRFDSRTGRSPIVDFLLAQKLTGDRLVKLFREAAHSDTLEFRKLLFAEMSRIQFGDPQRLRPHRGGDSELVAAGHCNLSGEYVWDELREIIQQFNVGKGMSIPNRCVAIDCGYAEKFNHEVLRKCYESATEYKYYDPMSKNHPPLFYAQPIHQYCLTAPRDGWLAIKGYPINQRWNHGGIRNEFNMSIGDPFTGTPNANTSRTEILEIASGLFWLRKEDLRLKRTRTLYSVSPECEFFPKIHRPDGTATIDSRIKLEDYQRHLNEQYYDEVRGMVLPKHGKGGEQARRHPYHLDDCETYQIALATYHEFFEVTQKNQN